MFNELLVYGGGVLTVLLTIIVYKLITMIPHTDKNMVSSTCVVGEIWLCLLYWHVLSRMDIPVWELVFTPIIFLIVFFLPFLIILFMLKVLIKMIYIQFNTDYEIWDHVESDNYKMVQFDNIESVKKWIGDELDDHKFILCSLFISPLPYLPLLFSFLIPLWNYLFK